MIVIGLTGGIASGKSTVARRLAELGAVVVDADALARQVLEPGTRGLAAVVERFGAHLVDAAGVLDRAALARTVFADDAARRDLESVVHPAVAAAFEERVAQTAAADPAAIVVHDVPLLVENALAPRYHLVLVTSAPLEERVRRAVTERGMTRQAVLARIAAQADDEARRAVADVVLDTGGPREDASHAVERLWHERLVPYEENVRRGAVARRGRAELVTDPPTDPWQAQAARVLARVRRAGGVLVRDVAHIGSTSIPGLPAKDVLDLQVGVASPADAAALAPLLAAAGLPRVTGIDADDPRVPLPGHEQAPELGWRKVMHANADPGRAVNLHVRVTGSTGWLWSLAFRDWLRADPEGRERYLAAKLATLAATRELLTADAPTAAYAEAKDVWFGSVAGPELAAWVGRSSWRPTP